jgi:DNA-binding FadR family transcriptional regulator
VAARGLIAFRCQRAPARSRCVADAAILRDGIERGTFPPGRKLPSEPTLAGEYGIARETARKAVRVLVAEGLVDVVETGVRGRAPWWHYIIWKYVV